jgi:hypothetical protein
MLKQQYSRLLPNTQKYRFNPIISHLGQFIFPAERGIKAKICRIWPRWQLIKDTPKKA